MSKNRSKNTRPRAQPLVSVGCCLLLGVVLAACPSPGDTTPTSTTTNPTSPPASTTSPSGTTIASALAGTTISPSPPVTSTPGPATSEPPGPSTTLASTTRPSSTEPGSTTTSTVPPLVRGEPIREWSFSEYRGDALELVELNSDIQVGGLLHELHDFGPTFRDSDIFGPDDTSLPSDGIATGQISSSADGVTYWVGAEVPRGDANVAEDPIGRISDLIQTQSFEKLAPDASLSFTVSAAFIETSDHGAGNAGEEGFPCPEVHQDGLRCDLIKGHLDFEVEAFTVPPPPDIEPFNRFFRVAGGATVIGNALSWDSEAWSRFDSRVPLWEVEDFDFVVEDLDGAREGLVVMTLRAPRTFTVDLSSLEVGQEFTLRSFAAATAYNRVSVPPGSSSAASATAFLRDPQGIDGTTVSFSGLEPIDDPGVAPPVEAPVAPAPCESQPDPDPAAGEIQFSAVSYTLTEANPTPTVTVTRTGGSTGAVTATISHERRLSRCRDRLHPGQRARCSSPTATPRRGSSRCRSCRTSSPESPTRPSPSRCPSPAAARRWAPRPRPS